MDVTIHDMESQDVPICASFINRRMLFEPNRLRDNTISDSTRLASKAATLQKDLDDPNSVLHVAKRGDEVLGWTSWLRPGHGGSSKASTATTVKAIGLDPERDYARREAMHEDKEAKHAKFFGDKATWMLQQLFVDPSTWRSGIGRKLFEHGLKEIGQAYIGLSSSPNASHLYRQYGFRIVSWFQYDVDDVENLDGQGETYMYRYRWPYMTNFWEGNEADVEAAEKRVAHEGKLSEDPELQR